MTDAINDLLNGGRALKFGLASVYALIATLGCLLIAWSMNRYKGTSDSTLVAVDVQAWLVDTFISASILIGFVIVYFIQDTSWNIFLPYVDSSLVVLLVLISLPIPIKILRENMREVLLSAPSRVVQEEIHSRLRAATKGHNIKDTKVRITKLGRYIHLNTYVIVDESFELSSIKDLDDIREKIDDQLAEYHPKIVSDIIFTEDKKWSD
jgi:predicted Co/Zn/Cd cation transporter (cation efflux family)